MTLIKSISGIRGTIGGMPNENLTPMDVVACAAGYATHLRQMKVANKIVIGRDARMSGTMVSALVANTLIAMGFDVVDLGLSTTPTVEIAVPLENAGGGIIITASHNPIQWNALKFLNHKGEFISAHDGNCILENISKGDLLFSDVYSLGKYTTDDTYIQKHIDLIFGLRQLEIQKIKEKRFKIIVDCINSTGAISVVPMLQQLGCEVVALYDDMSGNFAHNPEPLAPHLIALTKAVTTFGADLGISVDPDVDRLALVDEKGQLFGEEYTLVAVADYILEKNKGNTVSNLSSTLALRDITLHYGGEYHAAAVGEVNVVQKMKDTNAIIGGEGNGGIILPELHYGRDALVGIVFILSSLVRNKSTLSELKTKFPAYEMAKDKIELTPQIDVDAVLSKLQKKYENEDINTIDGLKIILNNEWVHLRKSNTEPIIRIYTESTDVEKANILALKFKNEILDLCKII
ncbi:MAG: phosphoglucosamine mutase [Saprospiraceae bacterium]|nr:phosphoglucosamine mutase [Saprospiraceae bacterium]